MTRTILIVFILFFSGIVQSFAQSLDQARKELNTLLVQRSSLFQEWKRNVQERNAFFGGQSKSDLKQVIATQQKIIELDNRIMDAIDKLNLAKTSSVIEKRDSLSSQTFRFNNDQTRLQNIIKRKDDRIQILKEDIRYHEKVENTLKGAFVLSMAILIALGLWIWSKR
ncbi:hypothetical protein C3K47_16555 [Solitalea longa]|uniref:Clp protease ClpB n=1 Tax=Solitalea longa TaxID=2079460 RepID=A0A2S4ZXW6_9SPHI|nr:hypothetical protein [Solitalea longa]POY35190.1 hypothetical protein C3K47_16555 [Solitalea longa]